MIDNEFLTALMLIRYETCVIICNAMDYYHLSSNHNTSQIEEESFIANKREIVVIHDFLSIRLLQ